MIYLPFERYHMETGETTPGAAGITRHCSDCSIERDAAHSVERVNITRNHVLELSENDIILTLNQIVIRIF
jgi:hypothetical protein